MTKLIGYSLSRCLRDVADGVVTLDQIERIEARTNFDPENEEHWRSIWRGYTVPNHWSDTTWRDYRHREEDFKKWTLELHRSGRLTQERRSGGWPQRRYEHWAEVSS